MRARLTVHWAAKNGNAEAEYEDAWAVAPISGGDGTFDVRGWRCAVADGASESLLAGRWATELTREFSAASAGATRTKTAFAEVAGRASRRWPTVVDQYVACRESQGRPLAWYENRGLDNGAFATLLMVEIAQRMTRPQKRARGTSEATAALTWRAAALGDTCVFQVRRDRLHAAFPMTRSGAFDTSPMLIGSNQPGTRLLRRRVARFRGELVAGDDLYVCTDALAAWFLAADENGQRPWRWLETFGREANVHDWLANERAGERMRNDDVTLLHLRVHDEHG